MNTISLLATSVLDFGSGATAPVPASRSSLLAIIGVALAACWRFQSAKAFRAFAVLASMLLGLVGNSTTALYAAEREPLPDFHQQVEPILVEYCYECHGLGEKKGEVAFDELKTEEQLLHNRDLWFKALRNVRSGIMPPKDHPRPNAEQQQLLARWIKYVGLVIDPADPDPGRVTLRRLNRVEYRNTIRDLMGYDYKTSEEFPTDDTGYGFDNIGDVLTVSPLLLEKYLKAADSIVAAAVPMEAKTIAERTLAPTEFKSEDGKPLAPRTSFYRETNVSRSFRAEHPGQYKIGLELTVRGQFAFDPGRCRVVFKVDDKEVVKEEYGWQEAKKYPYESLLDLEAGKHTLSLSLEPLTPAEQKVNNIDLDFGGVKIVGPMADEFRVPTKNYDRFFTRPAAPEDETERRAYARELIGRFAAKAYRRPVDESTIDRLLALAETEYRHPGKRFEDGIKRAMVAVLASPRFLFRIEQAALKSDGEPHPPIDEYALASRLSYFLWSTMPDEDLIRLADKGELRTDLAAQVKRMLADSRSQAMVQNFVGQWLQVRDVEGISINEQAIMAREDDELSKLLEQAKNAKDEFVRRAAFRALRFRQPKKVELDGELRKAMQQEAEMLFAHILQQDRSVCELIDSDYTFVNEKLAAHYGIPDIHGPQMRRIDLPKDSPRGGVLTMGAVLVVTSNPDRTSAVKRGLFVLDNILGSAPPPPPANIPALEDSAKDFKDKEPTLRELLEVHRGKALCSSCHSRMDPVGLGFDNFNAMGMWRESERGKPIDSAGELITGELFKTVQELKHTLANEHRADFYRCLTEKLLTYALGRGLTYEDVEAVDQIVDRLERENGKMSALLGGIIDSAPFQRRRAVGLVADEQAKKP